MMVGRRALICTMAATFADRYVFASPTLTSDVVNVRDFIPKGLPVADYTDVFMEAIQFASRRKFGRLIVPAGTFPLRKVSISNGVILEGSGRAATKLVALPSSETSFIDLNSGPILHSGLRNLSIVGGDAQKSVNSEQWAMHLTSGAANTGKPHGGLWWSLFENVAFNYFDNGVWFEGGSDNYMLPHQFVSLRDIVIYGTKTNSGTGLRITGQVNQFNYTQLHIDEYKKYSIELLESPSRKTSPKLHHFDIATFQNAKQAAVIKGAQNLTFSNCWFENNEAGILVQSDSFGISVNASRFANSGSTEAAVRFENNTSGSVTGNVFAGKQTAVPLDISNSADVIASGNSSIWGAGKTVE